MQRAIVIAFPRRSCDRHRWLAAAWRRRRPHETAPTRLLVMVATAATAANARSAHPRHAAAPAFRAGCQRRRVVAAMTAVVASSSILPRTSGPATQSVSEREK